MSNGSNRPGSARQLDARRRVRRQERAPRAADRVLAELQQLVARTAPGDPLPSVRELVARWAVSPVTVSRALGQLARQGLVLTRPGAGTFVAERDVPRARASFDWQAVALGAAPPVADLELLVSDPVPRTIALGNGYMDSGLEPSAALARAARRVLDAPGAWGRAPLDGLPSLRSWFAQRVAPDADAGDVLIVQGGQAAIGTALDAVTSPGAPLLVESPTYLGVLAVARTAGVRPVPVPVDAGGIRIDLLEAAFAQTGARALYLQPWFSNPTGAVVSPDRHAPVLRLAEQ
jgi:DNA-binding transcriptional MocR family regulator